MEKATAEYATEILSTQLPDGFTYHNLVHTQQVVAACKEIGAASGLSENEILILQTAAWFHDLGYVSTYINHEEVGMKMAREFLTQQEAPSALIDQIVALIEATKYNHAPRNLMERVIKDADLVNLTTPDALQNSQNIRQEWERFRNEYFTDKKWDKMNLYFLEDHEYYTEYGKEVLEAAKQKNIRKLKKKMGKSKGKDGEFLQAELKKKEKELKKLQKKLDKVNDIRPDRGIETMFRATYRVHINLSSIADNKANILLSINAIIISIVISEFIQSYNNFLIIPGAIMMLVCMSTIVFAILSTRPTVSSGIFDKDDILHKRTNLLFFGNFYKMEMEDYLWGIGEMMKDSDYLYGSMTKDIYFLGKVLARKFKLLRIAYNIFMYGMILVLIAFGLTYMLYSQGGAAGS